MNSASPPPDKSHIPKYQDETFLEMLYSAAGDTRAVLTRDRERHVRVRFEYWLADNPTPAYPASWIPVSHTNTITDTLERARVLAAEGLDKEGASEASGDV